MWSYLTIGSFINPLPEYVENQLVSPKVLRLDEKLSAHDESFRSL
jgi:hypothetical protein